VIAELQKRRYLCESGGIASQDNPRETWRKGLSLHNPAGKRFVYAISTTTLET
jgi:hypothetical protein